MSRTMTGKRGKKDSKIYMDPDTRQARDGQRDSDLLLLFGHAPALSGGIRSDLRQFPKGQASLLLVLQQLKNLTMGIKIVGDNKHPCVMEGSPLCLSPPADLGNLCAIRRCLVLDLEGKLLKPVQVSRELQLPLSSWARHLKGDLPSSLDTEQGLQFQVQHSRESV